jgi:acyl carrier protein
MISTLNEAIAEILDLDPEEVGDELSRETADNWDSLNHLRIVTAIERAFSIRLTMAEIESGTSVARLKEIVGARLGPQ